MSLLCSLTTDPSSTLSHRHSGRSTYQEMEPECGVAEVDGETNLPQAVRRVQFPNRSRRLCHDHQPTFAGIYRNHQSQFPKKECRPPLPVLLVRDPDHLGALLDPPTRAPLVDGQIGKIKGTVGRSGGVVQGVHGRFVKQATFCTAFGPVRGILFKEGVRHTHEIRGRCDGG
jgi:hypothetical protein